MPLNTSRLLFLLAALAAIVVLGVTDTVGDLTPWLALVFGAALPTSPLERPKDGTG